jgi:hypothetical protein
MFVTIIKGTKKFVQRVFVNKFNTLAVRAVWRSVLYTDISLRAVGGGRGVELRNSHSFRVIGTVYTIYICTQFTYLCTLYTHIHSLTNYIYFYVPVLSCVHLYMILCFYSFLIPGWIQGEDADALLPAQDQARHGHDYLQQDERPHHLGGGGLRLLPTAVRTIYLYELLLYVCEDEQTAMSDVCLLPVSK